MHFLNLIFTIIVLLEQFYGVVVKYEQNLVVMDEGSEKMHDGNDGVTWNIPYNSELNAYTAQGILISTYRSPAKYGAYSFTNINIHFEAFSTDI